MFIRIDYFLQASNCFLPKSRTRTHLGSLRYCLLIDDTSSGHGQEKTVDGSG